MKALILAAGLGTRLRPITDTIPKPLVPIDGKPLLAYHFDSLRKYGVNEVLINTHHLADQINQFVAEYCKQFSEFKVKISFEPKLLGSAGTLRANMDFFKGEENFLVVYGDNLTNINYEKFIDFHLKKGGLITIACYQEPYPESKGIIVFDEDKLITQFIEKPKPEQVISHYANAGIYVCNRRVFDYLKIFKVPIIDFGRDLFPLLLANEKMYAYEMEEFLLDIGTLATYSAANKIINKLTF